MASRRSNPRDSDKVQTRTCSTNAECIRSGDVSEALTEVLREAAVAKPFHWQFSHSKDCPITEDPDSVAHLAMKANNEFVATLEKRLQDVPRYDELYEIKKVAASLEPRLRVVSNERKSTLEQASFLEAKVESSANMFSDDHRRAAYDAKKALADSYLDVLVSLKEKWEKKKAATNCEARLREVMANIDLLKEIMNNNLLALDELLRLRTKEVELGSELNVMADSLYTQMVAQKARIAALEIERDRDIRRASRIARRAIATRYREILESLKDKWTSKKKEVSPEIQLQEVIANIDLLNELKDGGLTEDAELARLKEMEGDCEDLVPSPAVLDWSISELDLPQVSDDLADQVGGSSVPDDSGSS
ncbi:hypothetical protein F2Q69_00042994 [Brassica cretica]|uniref:Uncharacterized protein n=1 Tax=Brassica cretica TaxID=69181 RepID=A0A8S9NH99_BRACR|nr:hypothetical protein F2Q69_00042994 [Brassica cretica]